MNSDSITILLLADTHLGFDLPFRPRVERRRRGHDFFANFKRALEPAMKGEVDLVVHGGDLFFRSRIPDSLVQMAMAPLTEVAAGGVPVFLVPGNHERSRIPRSLWTLHENLHIFEVPCTFIETIRGMRVGLAGFPFERQARAHFSRRMKETGYDEGKEDIRLLCIHQAVEGARVGPVNFTFRNGSDVVCGVDIPTDFAAVLCGHIHRSQVLTHDLGGRRLGAPVIYPGSIERTSFAERMEDKHYAILRVSPTGNGTGKLDEISFIDLPGRQMVKLLLEGNFDNVRTLEKALGDQLVALDKEAVVQVLFSDNIPPSLTSQITASTLRRIAPMTMNVSLVLRQWQR